MLTNKDISKLEEKFVTKEEFFDLKDKMMVSFDAIMGEIKSMREELTVIFYRQDKNTSNIESNSKRIKSLEDKLSF